MIYEFNMIQRQPLPVRVISVEESTPLSEVVEHRVCQFFIEVKRGVRARSARFKFGCRTCQSYSSIESEAHVPSSLISKAVYGCILRQVAPHCACEEFYTNDSFLDWFERLAGSECDIRHIAESIRRGYGFRFFSEGVSMGLACIDPYIAHSSIQNSPWKEKFVSFEDIKQSHGVFKRWCPEEQLSIFSWHTGYNSIVEYCRHEFRKSGWSLGRVLRETTQKDGKPWFEPGLHPTPNDAYNGLSSQIGRYLKNNQLSICEKNRSGYFANGLKKFSRVCP